MSPEKTPNTAGAAGSEKPSDVPKKEVVNNVPVSAKSFLGNIRESLYKIPGISRVVGKMEIAFNKYWMESHEKKAACLKGEMGDVDINIAALDQSKEDMKDAIEEMKKQGIPGGAESLQIELRKIDEQKAVLLNKKDKIQDTFEARENKAKLYANRRDVVADKLIGRYNEKLNPMEKKLENLKTLLDRADLRKSVTEARHKELLNKLAGIEEKKTGIENLLRKIGRSERVIEKSGAVKVYENMLAQGREKIRMEQEYLAKERAEIDKKIAEVDKKANPYRTKREEFIRVKEGKLVEMNVDAREKGNEFSKREEIKSHTRAESPKTEEEVPEVVQEATTEKKESGEQSETVLTFVESWNKYFVKTYGRRKAVAEELIAIDDFLEATSFARDCKIDSTDFKKILGGYLKYKKLPVDKFNQSIDKFIEEKDKSKK